MAEKTVYEQLAASVGQGNSKIVPHIFKKLADEKEAAVVLAASPPRTVVQLAEETGFEESEVERMIDPLFKKGLMFKSKKSDATRYYRVRSFLQFHDSTAVMNDPPEGVMDLWKEWTAGEWIEASLSMDDHMPGPAMRVIPVNVAIDYNSQVLAMDDIADQIEQATTIAEASPSTAAPPSAEEVSQLPSWDIASSSSGVGARYPFVAPLPFALNWAKSPPVPLVVASPPLASLRPPKPASVRAVAATPTAAKKEKSRGKRGGKNLAWWTKNLPWWTEYRAAVDAGSVEEFLAKSPRPPRSAPPPLYRAGGEQ